MKPLRTREIFDALHRHGVQYVVIGGVGAVLHGSPLPTLDIDICPSSRPDNLERLAAAVRELNARVRAPDAPDGLPFDCDASLLASVTVLNLTTAAGDLDLTFAPAGTSGYDELRQNAVVMDIGAARVPVASLEDIIRSKEAANRPKDQRMLPTLRELLRRIKGGTA